MHSDARTERRRLRVLGTALLVGAMAWPGAGLAAESGGPGAEQIQFAAREHDLGYRAYLDKQFDEAATHFENAFFAAPNPAELRSAIRARRDAGELARAATLGAIGLRRFPDDATTAKVAADVIAQAQPHVHEIAITSSAEYSVAVDSKIVAAERIKESRVFVAPGPHELLVSWSDERDIRIAIDAREGGQQALQLEPPASAVTPPVPVAVTPHPVPVAPPPASTLPVSPAPGKPFGPAVFVTGAALTAVGLGFTIWSGIDTTNNPGVSAVRASCSVMGPDCGRLFGEGHGAEVRTNVFIALTGTVAAATAVVGAFFTKWSATSATSATSAGTREVAPSEAARPGVRVVPVLGIGQVGLQGSF